MSVAFDLPRYLSVLPLFADMQTGELQRLAASGCRMQRLSRGDAIFRVGESCDEFHVVVTGQVKLFAISSSGAEKVIELIGPGNSFGEAPMFSGKAHIVNAQALSETFLLTIAKEAVMEEIARDPRFSLRMLAGVSKRLHGMISDVESYCLHSGIQRVIGYLLRDHLLNDGVEDKLASRAITISLPVSKATIASRLSLTPEYFSRVLHELEAEGLIKIDRRDICILNTQGLASYQLQ
ncbi:Crp/Fnr family transcriptional regulator [Roseateles oligotrophus]|uniref:Crp/Fnr family transcriptional regulator n=1 Tax=Roseateles oligotrophus TaxID=1769250 RepID=A0ABT2YBL2_9BURK|nr:Crp/Fnr family transcriptional regulator [Roseateles oligotrophus]MCV2367472.1 Crp/Fnr family transcriptional regulator [Roseateles oligotrophus]